MTVIAMTREMGSLGRDVALGIAKRMNLRLVQHELVQHVADKMHKRENSVNRFLEGQAGLFERWGIKESDLSLYTEQEILEVALEDNVLIRGWGATYVLKDIPHVLKVRICAPVQQRTQALMERIGLDDHDVALREIQRNDAAHERLMRHLFHTNYDNPNLYDVVLNTQHVSVDACMDAIELLANRPERQTSAESLQLLQDRTLMAEVRAALHENEITASPTPSFGVELDPESRKVVVTGVALDARFASEVSRVVASVPGVVGVENRLAVLPSVVGP